jgi:ABC-2 type transport system permease protein
MLCAMPGRDPSALTELCDHEEPLLAGIAGGLVSYLRESGGDALLLGAVVGTLLAAALATGGLIVSGLATSNRVSLSVSLFLLLALFAPTQLPAGAQRGSVGGFLIRINPVTAGEHYLGTVLAHGEAWTRDLSYLVSPTLTVVLGGAVLTLAGDRILRMTEGGSRT